MSSQLIYPVKELQTNIQALESLCSLCLSEPEPKVVHRLRTLSRRIEAQMLLLHSLPSLRKHKKEARQLRKELKQLRQGAGEVRDLDVQRKRVEEFAEAEGGSANDPIAGNDENDGTQDDAEGRESLHGGAAVLDSYLQKKRRGAAAELQHHLQKHGERLTAGGQALLEKLDDAHERALSSGDLLGVAESLVSSDSLLQTGLRKSLSEDDLHTVRKVAKAARYLAEMTPGDRALETAAQRYKDLQDAGGAWHDDLELARTAKEVLGKKHRLTLHLKSDERRHLRLYREALRDEARLNGHPELAMAGSAI